MDDTKSYELLSDNIAAENERREARSASIENKLRAQIDTLASRNKELQKSLSTIAMLPHTCCATVGPRQCPPCAAHLYAYSRDKAENIADENNRIEAINTSILDNFYVDRIATEMSRDLLFNDGSSFWHSRIKQELQHAYDIGKVAGEAQNTRLRAVLDATEALRDALKAAGV